VPSIPLVLAALQDPKLFNKPPGSSYRLPKARRDLLIYPASIGLAASLLAACTGQWPYLPSQASAARPLASVPPPSRPIGKHKPPPATDALAPDAGVEVLAAEPALRPADLLAFPTPQPPGPAALKQRADRAGPAGGDAPAGGDCGAIRETTRYGLAIQEHRRAARPAFISTCAVTGCGRCTTQ
jgi:hypothetical protein